MLTAALLYLAYGFLNAAAMGAVKRATGMFAAREHRGAMATFAAGGCLYAGALVALVVLLDSGDASTVFPIAIGAAVLATTAVGAGFYAEPITARKLAGTLAVLAGIALTFLDGAPQ